MNCRTSLGLLIVVGIARTGVPLRAECATLPLDQQFERSSVVFVGRALSQEVITSVVPRETETTFEVERAWKGKPDPEKRLRVRTCGGVLNDEALTCGEAVRFEKGSRYVILAAENPPKTDVCDHTALVDHAEDTLRWLSTKKQHAGSDPAGVRLDRVGARLERILQDTGDRWVRRRWVHITAVPGIRDEQDIYEWCDVDDDSRRLFISIYHYKDAVEARERVEHLDLVIEIGATPVAEIGDTAKIATMRPRDPSAPGTVHFSVDWMYVQVSAPTVELATRLARGMADDLRSDVGGR